MSFPPFEVVVEGKAETHYTEQNIKDRMKDHPEEADFLQAILDRRFNG